MSDRVAYLEHRSLPRLALTGLALIWLSGCSSEVSRFDSSPNPFSNPFSSPTASAAPSGAAPAGTVSAAPLAPPGAVASAPLASAAARPAAPSAQAVGGSATGWTAVGGSPVVVGASDNLDTLSRRYGVPASALLRANGMTSASQVTSGTHLVVPVYNAGGRAVASAAEAKPAESKAKKREDVANAEPAKTKSSKTPDKTEKVKEADKKTEDTKAQDKVADKSGAQDKVAKVEPAKPAVVAKADVKAGPAGKKAIDTTPTGNVETGAAETKTALTGDQADASGVSPEFRWPARGRIIEGFKAGGNDGINIAVPSGTSVRAAESGVVVYSGDGLKGYGNLVLIKHPNGFVSAYANNGELDVKRGETVKRGQIIAKSGDTGNVNAPQLHFELRKGSTPVDPTSYLAGL
jgi:murein DD-endopeptidase MepM/ murein hydrolase activator NlpD